MPASASESASESASAAGQPKKVKNGIWFLMILDPMGNTKPLYISNETFGYTNIYERKQIKNKREGGHPNGWSFW